MGAEEAQLRCRPRSREVGSRGAAMREAVIVDTVRTPIGKRKGALVGLAPDRPARVRAARAPRPQRRRPGARRGRRRRLRDAGRRAGLQRHAQRLGRRRPAVARAGHVRRPPVRVVAAGDALRRPGRHGRRLRPRDRVWRRVDDPRTHVEQRPRRDGPVLAGLPRGVQRRPRHPVLGRAGARRQVRRDARGDGRVRRREPAARGREHRQRPLRQRDDPGAAPRRGGQRDRRDARGRRGHPARHHRRGPGRAAARVGVRRAARPRHHRGERVADERRRGRDARSRSAPRPSGSACRSGPASRTSPCWPTIRCSCSRRRTRSRAGCSSARACRSTTSTPWSATRRSRRSR